MTKQKMIETVGKFQEIQKVNHPDSLEWIKASKEINALAKMINELEKDNV